MAASPGLALSPRARTATVAAHVVASIGWLGAVLAFIAVATVALSSENPQRVRGAVGVMEPLGSYVILPLVIASLVTGVVLSLGTQWGLFRHYWVVFKLVIAAASTAILVQVVRTTFSRATEAAANPATPAEAFQGIAGTLRAHAFLTLGGLLVATALAMYKPRGLSPIGRREQAWRDRAKAARRQQRQPVMAGVPAGATVSGAAPPLLADPAPQAPAAGARRPALGWVKAVAAVAAVVAWTLWVCPERDPSGRLFRWRPWRARQPGSAGGATGRRNGEHGSHGGLDVRRRG